MSGRPSRKSAEIGLFRPFSALFALLRRVRRAPGKSRKLRKKAFFLRYPRISLHPHLLNPHLWHPNLCCKNNLCCASRLCTGCRELAADPRSLVELAMKQILVQRHSEAPGRSSGAGHQQHPRLENQQKTKLD